MLPELLLKCKLCFLWRSPTYHQKKLWCSKMLFTRFLMCRLRKAPPASRHKLFCCELAALWRIATCASNGFVWIVAPLLLYVRAVQLRAMWPRVSRIPHGSLHRQPFPRPLLLDTTTLVDPRNLLAPHAPKQSKITQRRSDRHNCFRK